jgi:glycine/D-amino acid oxidase-like deaminating enzyme
VTDYSRFSFWLDALDDDLTPRSPLEADIDVDVAVVGAGYTGLWTAYYLAKTAPGTRIAVVEAEIAGFGASGRNGGWCSALFAPSRKRIAAAHGREAAIAMQHAMFATVDEVGRAAAEEGIDCDFLKGGTLTLVTAPAQLERVKEEVEEQRSWGFGLEHYAWLDADEAAARIRVAGNLGAAFTPHCARIQPAKLVRGLAKVVERQGTAIYEGSPVTSVEGDKVVTPRGTVTAPVVVRATEAFTGQLPGMERAMAPLYSLMIATEPLSADAWDAIGWSHYETFHDGRHLLIYAQRTADDRIAIGGRGAPYHFRSKIAADFEQVPKVHAALERVLKELFPVIEGAKVTHTWGGAVAAPRDWYSSVGFHRPSGRAWAGGYVGDGVSTSNLAGRTLTDLILGRDTELTRLPWVNHISPRWEPEPLRWLGINGALQLMASADRAEERSGKPAKRAAVIEKLLGI